MRKESLATIFGCLILGGAVALLVEVREHKEAPALPPPPPSASVRAPLASSPHYFGNVNTHKFHRATCRYATCRNCTAQFATREEAVAAGFRPCGNCDP